MIRAHLAVAVPVAFLCTISGPGSGNPSFLGSIGGGPPGGVRASTSAATPSDYGDCGPGAIRETGLQGQVPRADQRSGRSRAGYRCNLRLVGEQDIKDRGANFQLGWYRRCAYVGSVGVRDNQTDEGDELDGVAVIDASNPRQPKLARFVRAPGGVSQHEAVEVNARRGMLVVQTGGISAQYIDLYDVSENCRKPVFKGRYDAGRHLFHGQRISADGRTVYATSLTGGGSGQMMHVIDVSRMSKPTLIAKWAPTEEVPSRIYGIHDLDLSADGNRAYLGTVSLSTASGSVLAGPPSNVGPSMVVLDTSEVQRRVPNPDLRVISDVWLPNFGHTEQRARIDGKPYVFTSGETPFTGARNCPWAWGDVIDISDERNPRVVSEIKLEVNELENCASTGADNAVYSIHYVGVDDPRETTMVFYTYYTGGVRAFDVRDPEHPVEIAYYHPPPVPDTVHEPISTFGGDYQNPAWDSATSDIRYLPNQRRLWFVSIGRGFQILELTTPEAEGRARLLRQTRAAALKRRSVKAKATCSRPCRLELRVRIGARRSPGRTVEFAEAGRRRLRIALGPAILRQLRRKPSPRLRILGAVRDPDTDRLIHRFRSKPRRLARRATEPRRGR